MRETSRADLDWCALALAIWLAALVGTRLVMHLPTVQAPPETPAWQAMAGGIAAF